MQNKDVSIIKDKLLKSLPTGSDVFSRMKRSVAESQGKYLRARLCMAFAYLFRYQGTSLFDLSCAIELIHLASLLQDDVFDNEEHRRRKPAFHMEWDKTMSILYSDIILSKAFSTILGLSRSDIAHEITDAVCNMCEGELLHRYKNSKKLAVDEYVEIVAKKTASLFSISCRTGAMLGTDRKEYINIAGEFGFNFGIAYQLIDDCRDLVSDLKNNIVTMPRILNESSCESTMSIAMDYVNQAALSLPKVTGVNIRKKSEELFDIVNWIRGRAVETKEVCKACSFDFLVV